MRIDARHAVLIGVAQRLGITSPLEPNRSLPLGTSEVTLYEMTKAFGVLARGGLQMSPYIIEEIRNSRGDLVCISVGPK